MELITKVYGDGTSTNIDILSIPQTYRDLRITGYSDSSSSARHLRINAFGLAGDSIYLAGGATGVGGLVSSVKLTGGDPSGTAPALVELEFPGYTNTTIRKNVVYRCQLYSGGGVWLWSGTWTDTNAVTAIRFTSGAAWTTNTYFELWGL